MPSDVPSPDTQSESIVSKPDAEELEAARNELNSNQKELNYWEKQSGTIHRTENPLLTSLEPFLKEIDKYRLLYEESKEKVKKLEEAASKRNK